MVLVAVQLSVPGLYLPPVFRRHSAPDDHFTAGPHCRVIDSRIGRVGGAGGCPTVRAGIISAAGVQSRADDPPQTIISLPVHTAVCKVRRSRARWWCWSLSNCRCWDCIFRRCSNRDAAIVSAPDDHFTAGPHCRVTIRASGALVVLVAVQLSVLGLYLPPVLNS